jgi:endogenous inhibitor of DNA gyrase (YacG/DUF329 family)
MDMKADYAAAWRDFRRRRMIFCAVFLGYMPGVLALFFVVGLPLASLTEVKSDYFFYAIALCWMAALLVTSIRAAHFPCPGCGKRFFATWWSRNPFARKCLHCDLPKWATSDDQIPN